MAATSIEWATDVWNPVSGCRKVSPGCAHCYAETFARRGMGPWKGRRFEDVRTHADRLDAPLRARKPRRYFVNSMSDLFHEDVPDEFLDRCFAVMAFARRHTFIVLTKRPERMRTYLRGMSDMQQSSAESERWDSARLWLRSRLASGTPATERRREYVGVMMADTWSWARPIPNIWLGVSCEDQQRADERVPLLLDTPAAVRLVSAEPLLGPIQFGVSGEFFDYGVGRDGRNEPRIHWVIVGGESGPGARTCDVAWVRDIVRRCSEAAVACFVKQLGARPRYHDDLDLSEATHADLDHSEGGMPIFPCVVRPRNRKGGDITEFPADLRVREYPTPP